MGPESAGYAAPVSQRRVARVSPATGRRTCQSHSVLEQGTEGGALLQTCAHVPVDKDCGNVPAVVWMRSGRVLLAVVDVQGPENTATIHTPVLFLTRPPQPVAPASHTQWPWRRVSWQLPGFAQPSFLMPGWGQE